MNIVFRNIEGSAEVGNNEFIIVPSRKEIDFLVCEQEELSLLIGRSALLSKTCDLPIDVTVLVSTMECVQRDSDTKP